ncbi:MAG: response regulator [Lachnospiraceae bacterium]|nr:response regulator [Lachnospiraceae bacterium]
MKKETDKGPDKNKKIGFWRLWVVVGIVILMMLLIVYLSLNNIKRDQSFQTSDLLIDRVKNVIHGNERKEQSLTDSLKESYISKAKAVAYIIDNNPETEYEIDELKRIAKLMSIDEIHLFTADGEIYSGTVPEYYGYTFDSGDQMGFFKPMLKDKQLAMCQDVTPNTAESKPMMYAICWNDSGTRMIQAGIEPKRLIEERQSNEISQVVANIPAYDGVNILVADEKSKVILGATDTDYIGKSMSDIGLATDYGPQSGIVHFPAVIGNRDAYCAVQNIDSYIIAVIQYKAEVNREIPLTLILVFIYLMVAGVTLAIIVKRMADRRERLQTISERAIAASAAKTSFLSNMSHEIRTPINAILGMNEMVMRECGEPEIRMYAQNIKNAGNTLLGIVNDILDFSKIEENKLEIIPVNYDLSSVINDLVNMIKTRLDDKGLTLKLDFDKDTPRVLRGDEIRIKQIITNILTNAAKYTEKGSVTFSLTFDTIEEDPDAIYLVVSIKDTGIGIKAEDMQKLFSRFERIEESRNRSIEGTGLGMSITKRLLEMMGSSLEVESVYGKGSVFGFSIKQEVVKWEPLGDYEEAWKTSIKKMDAYKEKFVAPDAEILVVDDNSLNITVFVSLLKQTKIRIDTASSGNEGIALALRKHYDMIFLDHMMPEKDGIETLQELKADPDNPNWDTPYICLTANAISGAREEYIKAGFGDYLTKPVNTDELEEMLLKYLPEEKVILRKDADGTGNNDSDKAVCRKNYEDSNKQSEQSGSFGNIKSDEQIDFPKRFRILEDAGIDVAEGIKNCDGAEQYDSILEIFCDSMEDLRKEIEELYRDVDYKNYTTKVHALKSSARIIGATSLGEEAQELENAGKREDLAYISEHHEAFIEKYLSFKEPLLTVLGRNDDNATETNEVKALIVADKTVMEAAYEEMEMAAQDMDSGRLDDVFDEMKGYSIPEEEKELFGKLEKAAYALDYDMVLELLKERNT